VAIECAAARLLWGNPVVDGVVKTFELLATTKTAVAIDLLVAALDSTYPVIRERAAAAMLQRGATRCQTEIIRRLASLSAASRKLLDSQGTRLATTLRQCVLHGDPELRINALTIVTSAECYDQVPTLLQLLRENDLQYQDAACRTLQELVTRLDEQCHPADGRKQNDRFARNLPRVRHMVLAALEEACNRFESLTRPREILECILALGDPENHAVQKVLSQGLPACREMAAELLLTSKRPGVFRLLMECMDQNYPHAKAIEAFEKRVDRDFVCAVLGSFPLRLSENQQKNFKQLTRIAWISDRLLPLATIPPELHESLLNFLQATGIDVRLRTEIEKWMLLHGSVAARSAASRALETNAPDSVRQILFEHLESPDEAVQAWATSQLRSKGVPEAIRLLIERLDSPLAAVREAARGELNSFNLELVLSIFEHLDRTICQRAGALVRKIDANCSQKLLAELASPIRHRRIRAARAAQALGLARDVESGLLSMLSDADALVRRTAAEVLVCVPTPEVVARLGELLEDVSPRVREAVEHSLLEIQRTGLENGLQFTIPPAQPDRTGA
jgi:HEAT repeat protein